MKKWIALSLALLMTLSLCACGTDDSGKKEDGSKDGKVTAAKLTQVVMTEKSSTDENHTMKAVLEYDENQNVIASKTYLEDKLYFECSFAQDMNKPLLEVSYNDNGDVMDRTEYTYDEKGNCVERISTYNYDDQTVTNKRVSTYDANGNVLTEVYYENGTRIYEQRYTYTADGKLAREAYINKDGDEESVTEKTYDEQGNILSVNVDGMLSGSYETYENTYEDGKLVEVKIYESGELFSLTRYDSDGNRILHIGYDGESGEEWSRTEYTYENGKLVKVVDFDNGEKTYEELYTYNATGKLTERSRSVTDGESQRSVYRYDEAGNITGFKRYEGEEVKADYTMTYETVTVSEAVAEKLREIADSLGLD